MHYLLYSELAHFIFYRTLAMTPSLLLLLLLLRLGSHIVD